MITETFWTSDTHFGDNYAIESFKRPFRSTKDMDETLIAHWNAVIKNDCIVYHLGDFGESNIDYYRSRLNGTIIQIKGNHDQTGDCESKLIDYEGQRINMCHIPRDTKFDAKGKIVNGILNIAGHIHQRYKVCYWKNKKTIIVNVCTDIWGFKPVTFNEIKEAINHLDLATNSFIEYLCSQCNHIYYEPCIKSEYIDEWNTGDGEMEEYETCPNCGSEEFFITPWSNI